MPTIQAQELIGLGRAIFEAVDTPADIAETVTKSLVKSNLMGHDSHGVLRIPRYVRAIRQGGVDPGARPEIDHQNGGVAAVNGNWGFGQITARFATDLSRDLAREYGLASVALNRVNHIGRLGEYAQMLADEGLISMIMTTSSYPIRGVAPFGGQERVFSTNPIAWALPVDPSRPPLVVDFATAGTAEGKLAVALSKGEQIPPGLLLDNQGQPSTEPASYYDGGALLPFGGHKGYGLMLMIQLMGNILSDYTTGSITERRLGNPTVITAWSIEGFLARERYEAIVEEWLQLIKNSKPAPGFSEVLLPGEPEARSLAQRSRDGIPVPEATWQDLLELAAELKVSV